MIKKFCTKPGCKSFAEPRSARCHDHAIEKKIARQDFRASSSERGYGAYWQKLRLAKLAKNPLCEICYQAFANVVHHKDHDQKNNRNENLQSTCRNCHEKHHGRKK